MKERLQPGANRWRERLRRAPLTWWVAWSVLLTYLVAGRVVRNFFPISVFDMYQARADDVSTRILFLDEAGHSTRLGAWSDFVCEPERPAFGDVTHTCGEAFRPIPYVARDQQVYFDAHRGHGEGGETVLIVARAHWLAEVEGRPLSRDCELARCRATSAR